MDYPEHILEKRCLVCSSYALAIRVCNGEGAHKVVMCDECYTPWFSPELEEHPDLPNGADIDEMKCPYGDGSLFEGDGSYWATEEEIKEVGWWGYIDEK